MVVFALSFLVGVSQLLWLPRIDFSWIYSAVLVLALSLFSRNRTVILSILAFVIGFSWGLINASIGKSHQLTAIPQESQWLTGKIIGLPQFSRIERRFAQGEIQKVQFLFEVTEPSPLPVKKIWVSCYDCNESFLAGQVWKLNLKLKPIHGFYNPASFDYSRWLFRRGIDAQASVVARQAVAEDNISLMASSDRLRAAVVELIADKFENPRVESLVMALTVGDKSKISKDDSELFRETGTAHIIAISGLHIGLVAFIGVLFGRVLFWMFASEKWNRFYYQAFFAIVFACSYALLAGLSIPTIRAMVMVAVFSLAYAFKLNISRWQAWSLALLVILVFDPLSVLDVGFWFSFGAVALLMFAFVGRSVVKSKVLLFFKAQLVILIGLMPLMAVVFQQLNLVTPLANILVLPVASLLLIPLIFAAFVLYLLSLNRADFLFNAVEMVSIRFYELLDYLHRIDFLTFSIASLTPLMQISLVLASLLLLLPRLFPWRWLAAVLLLPLFFNKASQWKPGEFSVSVLDVGQGLSAVIATQDHVLIYDTGAKMKSGFSLASAVVLPFLRAKSLSKIDKMVLSHADNDHAGGAEDIIKYFKSIDVLAVTDEYQPCRYPLSWQWNAVDFEILSPFELYPYMGNNSSCVLKISSEMGSILLTGDIEEAIEYRLTHQLPEKIKSEVLLVPHHGSRTSSHLSFVQAVKPIYAVNSSGYGNQFNHPHPDIKQLYLDQGIAFYDTQDKGMIEILFVDHSIQLNQYAETHPHFWFVSPQ